MTDSAIRTLHIPRVRVITPEPDKHGMTPSVFTRILVDDKPWAITGYTIQGNVDGIQTVTLTILADITVERPTAKTAIPNGNGASSVRETGS